MNFFKPKPNLNIKKKEVIEKIIPNNSHSSCIEMIFIDKEINIEIDNFNLDDFKFLENNPTPFYIISNVFEKIEKIKGVNSQEIKKSYITNLFKILLKYNKEELPNLFYFCNLKLEPEFLQKDLGIGDDNLAKIVSSLIGKNLAAVRTLVHKIGDLGLVYHNEKGATKSLTSFFKKEETKMLKKVTFNYVFSILRDVSFTTGNKSKQEKERLIMKWLQNCDKFEGKFILRFILKNFKIGAAGKFFQKSLVKAFFDVYGKDEDILNDWELLLNKIFNQFPHIEMIINNFIKLKNPILLKDVCKLKTGIPCKPMLAKPTKEIAIIFKRFKDIEFTCEYKYDGFRGQIHYNKESNPKTNIFSRNLENMTSAYPDIIISLSECLKENVTSIIIDSEIVPYDLKNKRILPFKLITKRSKKEVDIDSIECNVCLYCFDILYLNGENLLNLTLKERRVKLNEAVNFKEGKVIMTNYKDLNEIEQIEKYLDESIVYGCEGLMVKTLVKNSTYEPSLRTFKWLKLKKDYLEGVGDSFDFIPIGAIYGEGSRKNTFGTFLLGLYNVEYDRFEVCTKVGTGLSDENLKKFYEIYKNRITKNPSPNFYNISKVKDIDVWFDPFEVWEVKAADLQVSPVYSCCSQYINDEEGWGIGFRFPRFLRQREDKKIIDCTQPKFIYEIYKGQALIDLSDEGDDY